MVQGGECRGHPAPCWRSRHHNVAVRLQIAEALQDEERSAVDPDYMSHHSARESPNHLWINPTMRYMTVNWMSEVAQELCLNQVCPYTGCSNDTCQLDVTLG